MKSLRPGKEGNVKLYPNQETRDKRQLLMYNHERFSARKRGEPIYTNVLTAQEAGCIHRDTISMKVSKQCPRPLLRQRE